jgi:hypothetical protein
MKLRLSTVAILSLLASCSGEDDSGPTNIAGSPVAGTGGVGGGGSGGGGAAGAAGNAGMGGGGGDPTAGASGSDSTIPATFETVKLVFGGGGGIMTCAAAPCHGAGGMAPPADPLELPTNDDALLYTSLTSYVSKACNNTPLVTPGNPAQSALITILRGPCGMTPRMPYGCTAEAGDCIPDDYIAAVAQWIADGASQQ